VFPCLDRTTIPSLAIPMMRPSLEILMMPRNQTQMTHQSPGIQTMPRNLVIRMTLRTRTLMMRHRRYGLGKIDFRRLFAV